MQWKYKAVRLGVLAALAISGAASAQTNPPASQTSQTPSQNPPGPVNPNDPSTAQSPATGPGDTTGVPGGTSGGRPSGAEEVVVGGGDQTRKSAQEEIVVTGSRVRRKDLTTPAPVTVINKEQIQSSGIAAIGDFLQQMPEQAGGTNTNVNNGGDGETAISLRNLGPQRTLVLVDGKRWVNGGSGAGTFVDLNSIPTAAIERVEVLKDGASAVYGSDAIGGVVNIITRRRVNGVELSAYGGLSGHSDQRDAQQYDLSVTGGAAGEKGSFMFSAGYFDQKAMSANNRDWARHALGYNFVDGSISPGGSSRIPQGRVRVDPSKCASVSQLCADLLAKYGAGPKNFMRDPTNPNPPKPLVDGWRQYTANDAYNYQAVNFLITPSTRINLFSNGDFHISDSARAYFQGSFVNRQSSNLLAPEPLDLQSFGGLTLSKDNQFNRPENGGFGTDIFDVRRRLVEYAGRSQGFDLDTIRTVAGIDGTLPDQFGPLSGVFWDVSFNYGRTSGVTTTYGSLDTTKVQNGIGPSYKDATGTWRCGTDPATGGTGPIAGCTPVNLFGAGSLNPDMISALGGYKGINQGFTQIAAVQANISAELVKLGSERPVGLAAGYEYRALYGGFIPNAIAQQFNDSDYNGAPTQGSYHVNEGYAELDIPLVGGLPGAEDVEIQAAGRVFNYSTFGTDYTYKLGGRWRPIRDVTLRGTYSTGFRAPDVTDLYGGRGPSAESASDPCGNTGTNAKLAAQCAAGPGGAIAANNGDDNVQINSTVGGSAKLQPEKAKIGTVGMVFEPQAVRGLSATVDYWNVQVSQLLGFYTTAVILSSCYPASDPTSTAQPNKAFCDLITRNANTGQIANVNDYETNVGRIITSGIDFALRYGLPTEVGRFGFLFDSTYLINYNVTVANGQTYHSAGNYDSGLLGQATGGLTPRVKFNAGVNYSLAGLSTGVRGRYIGAFDECADPGGVSTGNPAHDGASFCSVHNVDPATGVEYPHHTVSAYVTFDAFASYLLRNPFGSTTFSIGVRNLANAQPPRNYNSFLTYADPAYDFVGRFVYGRITHSF